MIGGGRARPSHHRAGDIRNAPAVIEPGPGIPTFLVVIPRQKDDRVIVNGPNPILAVRTFRVVVHDHLDPPEMLGGDDFHGLNIDQLRTDAPSTFHSVRSNAVLKRKFWIWKVGRNAFVGVPINSVLVEVFLAGVVATTVKKGNWGAKKGYSQEDRKESPSLLSTGPEGAHVDRRLLINAHASVTRVCIDLIYRFYIKNALRRS